MITSRFLMIAATAGLAGAAGCMTDADEAPSESSTQQDSKVVYSDCPATCGLNAQITMVNGVNGEGGGYQRTPQTSCAQQTTLVGVINQNTKDYPYIDVSNVIWNLTSANREQECLESTLAVRIEQGEGTDVCGLKQVYYSETHPVWANNSCEQARVHVDIYPGDYVVRALAIDGDNVAYDEVQMDAEWSLDGTGWMPTFN